MDPTTQRLMMGAAGSGGEKLYIEDVFSTWLYTGNGSTQTITNGIDLSGKGGLVWIKGRSGATNHRLFDTAQGATNFLESNTTNPQGSSAASLTSFNSDGFSIGASSPINTSSSTYASLTFRKAAKFFDVVTYVGDGIQGRQIAHNLGSTPGMILVKMTAAVTFNQSWYVWHRSVNGGSAWGTLNSTSAFRTDLVPLIWGDGTNYVAPTSTNFTVGLSEGVNESGATYVAYLFAHDAGGFGDSGNDSVVKCGSFTASATGSASVDLGWEPQFIIAKAASTTGGWFMADIMRGWSLTEDKYVYANTSGAEVTNNPNYWNPTATGFICKDGCFPNNSTVIYIAIRRGPMKTPTDATKVFSAVLSSSSGSGSESWTTGFPVDLALWRRRPASDTFGFNVSDRVRGANPSSFGTASTASESNPGSAVSFFDSQISFATGTSAGSSGQSMVLEAFRRAPGFFDIVGYTGDGSTATRLILHNLGVRPELVILKRRNASSVWAVADSFGGQGTLSTTKSFIDSSNWFAGEVITTPAYADAATFSVSGIYSNNIGAINASGGTYIAYLFATCSGVSKVGRYTGTGGNVLVDCSFTNGAQFVLIKRADDVGGWYVWDAARGITFGNDPYVLANSSAAEVTSTDYLSPYSLGFIVKATAPADLNASGGSYIYLAIA